MSRWSSEPIFFRTMQISLPFKCLQHEYIIMKWTDLLFTELKRLLLNTNQLFPDQHPGPYQYIGLAILSADIGLSQTYLYRHTYWPICTDIRTRDHRSNTGFEYRPWQWVRSTETICSPWVCLCDTITSCYGAHDYMPLQATQSRQQQLVAEDTVTFHLRYDESREIWPAGRCRMINL